MNKPERSLSDYIPVPATRIIKSTDYSQYIVQELETLEQKFAGYKCSSRVEDNGKLGRVYKNR